MSKPTELGSLKIGSYILLPEYDQPTGDPCSITEYDTSKPGNHGSAKATDIAKLIRLARKTVYEKYGVMLELEVNTIGFSKSELDPYAA